MKIAGEVESQFLVEIERRLVFERNRSALEESRNSVWRVNGPFTSFRGAFDGGFPLSESAFLTDVDFLSASDQTDDHAPLRNAVSESDELLGLAACIGAIMFCTNHVRIVRSLRFVEYEHVLRRYR